MEIISLSYTKEICYPNLTAQPGKYENPDNLFMQSSVPRSTTLALNSYPNSKVISYSGNVVLAVITPILILQGWNNLLE